MKQLLLSLGLVLATAFVDSSLGCTVFYAAQGDIALGGNNEDWHDPLTKLWFVPRQNGKHGVVYVTFSNHRSIQGGMNDQGLFFDFLAVKPRDVQATPDKPRWTTHPLKKIMEECATVNEAVEILENHNRAFMRRICIFLGDAQGDSAIVEAEAVVKKEGTFQVATNFRQSLTPPSQSKCWRSRKATKMLSEADDLSVDLFRRICAAVHQKGKNPTLYSTIYDTKRRVIYLYHYHNFEEVVVLDLEEELAKGERILDMPSLFPSKPSFEQYRRASERQARSQQDSTKSSQRDARLDRFDRAVGGDRLKTVAIRDDVHVRERIEWRDAHYQIHGNIIFHDGGELVVENATVSLMCTYAREFRCQWEGGNLFTRHVTIGGTKIDGIVGQTYFEIQNGEWISEDTTIRYSSGVTMGWQGHPVRFHATRLRAGPNPDSIIMSSAAADVVLRDSEFNISLAVSASNGGKGRLDLPVNEPITRVFDGSNVTGVKYRLELVNTRVALWWVFFSGIKRGGPETEIVLGHCPRLIPSVIAQNLQGPLELPAPWPSHKDEVTELTIGNLKLKTVGQPVSTWCWGVYLGGEETDVVVRGRTVICELFVSDGKVVLEGDAQTYNAVNSCTTVEVGHRTVVGIDPSGEDRPPSKPVELVMRNVTLGRFMKGDVIVGQITAHADGRIRIEHGRCAPLKLLTRSNGTISMSDIERNGELELIEQGGAITIDP